MNIVGYCRVSTAKESQISSLEHQKEFFEEYAKKNGHNLVELYADEGITGTKLKNRKEFNRLMVDAHQGLFELVVVKDIARFARNTVDFLQNIRTLKSLNININFVTNGMETLGNGDSELTLTMLAAVAQEESVNTSIKIKFGKKINAQKGKVPNFIYGYDKTVGEYFDLKIIQGEAAIVKRIFNLYTEHRYGTNKIATLLNEEGILTRRGCSWSQVAISRILSNRIYNGQVINGKEEIKSLFDTKRNNINEDKWLVTEKPELRIISEDQFDLAQSILKERKNSFKSTGKRETGTHIFSGLIKCSECGYTFRKITRTYKNTYITWVCSGRNLNGIKSCCNTTTLYEDVLITKLKEYFMGWISNKHDIIEYLIREFKKQYRSVDDNKKLMQRLVKQLNKLKKQKDKDMEMFSNDIITIEELKIKAQDINHNIKTLETELKIATLNVQKSDILEERLNDTFSKMELLIDVESWNHWELKNFIDQIIVTPNGEINIYLKSVGDLFLNRNVQLNYNRT